MNDIPETRKPREFLVRFPLLPAKEEHMTHFYFVFGPWRTEECSPFIHRPTDYIALFLVSTGYFTSPDGDIGHETRDFWY